MKLLFTTILIALGLYTAQAQSVQQKLNNGITPQDLVAKGLPVDSLYGKTYQAGIIFYYDPELKKGMVMSKTDMHYAYDKKADKIFWNCVGTVTGATKTGLWKGEANTKTIVEAQCKLYEAEVKKWLLGPADICTKYAAGGYTNWYLPSRDELKEMYNNLVEPGRYTFPQTLYWSSSEKNENFAWIQYMPDGGQAYYIKYYNRL